MRRFLRVLGKSLLALVVLLIVLVGGAVLTIPRWLPSLLPRLSGGMVTVDGLDGRMPDQWRLAHVEVKDTQGVWLTLDNVTFDWSPLALLQKQVKIDALTAGAITVTRLPVAPASAPAAPESASSGPLSLPPVHLALETLRIRTLSLPASLTGHPATLALQGDASVNSLTDGKADILIQRQDSPGRYEVHATLAAEGPGLSVALDEPADGLLSGLAKMPTLGAIHVAAAVQGPLTASRVTLQATAGPLSATANGTVDITGHAIPGLDVGVQAPAMSPAPQLSWQSVDVSAHVTGPFNAPDVSGHVTLASLKAYGAALQELNSQFSGNDGHFAVDGSLNGLVIPGPSPTLFAASPVAIKADLSPQKVAHFAISHPLLTVSGEANLATPLTVTAHAGLPDLAPFAAIGGVTMKGQAALDIKASHQDDSSSVAVDGTVGIGSGPDPLPGLIGDAAKISAAATMAGGKITLSGLNVAGKAITLSAKGTDDNGTLGLDWQVAFSDLKVLAARVAGTLAAKGTVSGPPTALAVVADVSSRIGVDAMAPEPITLHAALDHLPATPTGTVSAEGSFAGSPVTLDTELSRDADGTMHTTIRKAAWKSLLVSGTGTLAAGSQFPAADMTMSLGNLRDLATLTGQPLAGSLKATVKTKTDNGAPVAVFDLKAQGLSAPGARIASASVSGTASNILAAPTLAATLNANGVVAGGATSTVTLGVKGGLSALELRLKTLSQGLAGADATTTAAATVNVSGKSVRLSQFDGGWHGESVHLSAPMTVSYGNGVTLDRLALSLAPSLGTAGPNDATAAAPATSAATLTVSGRVMPSLALTVSAHNITPELAKPFQPDLAAAGTVTVEATLSGTPAAPGGHVQITGTGLKSLSGPAKTLAPATLSVVADIANMAARLKADVTQGANHVTVAGTASANALDLTAGGQINLAVLDPILLADGRRVHGSIALNATIQGAPSAPAVNGSATLTNGEIQDYTQGVHLTAVTATLTGDGQTIKISSLQAKAGGGSVSGSGTLGLAAPQPLSLKITARDAQMLSSDMVNAVVTSDLTIGGSLEQGLNAGGTLEIGRAELRIPEQMPVSVAKITVVRPGDKPAPPPAAPAAPISLNIRVRTHDVIFVRGHGLDAELTGNLQVGGTAADPAIGGGFTLRRGSFSLASTTLNFTSGSVHFDSGHGYDPALNFVASNTSDNVVATLTVGGYASKPKITLSSVPDLPQDEIMSHLLFSYGTAQQSPLQLAEIASALASLSGVNPGVSNPLDSARQFTGLDRLSVGSSSNSSNASSGNSSPTLEGGRYVAKGVYVGAKQGTAAGDTTAEVRIDLTNRLKLETEIGNNKNGSNVGVTYQFEY